MYNYLVTISFCCNFLQMLKNYLSKFFCVLFYQYFSFSYSGFTQKQCNTNWANQEVWLHGTISLDKIVHQQNYLSFLFFFCTIFIWNQQDGITQWKEVQEYLFDDTMAELSSGQFVSNKNTWFSWLTSFIIFVSILKFL